MNERCTLEGMHYAVTGGAGALGAAVVSSLVERGAQVTVLDRAELRERGGGVRVGARGGASASPREAGSTGTERAAGQVHSVVLELVDEKAVAAAYATLARLDGSIHCAGGFDMKPIAETSLADLDAMWRMNAVSCFLCCREAVRAMRRTREARGRAAASPHGWIVNIAARPALVPVGGMIAYSMSKAGVATLTPSLAAELLAEGIFVNAVVPSVMDTPANRRAMPTADHSKWPKVEEVARVIRALASPENHATSGALVPVYGAA